MYFNISGFLTGIFGKQAQEPRANSSDLCVFKDYFYAHDPIPTDKNFWDDILERCDNISEPADKYKAASILYGWYPPLMAEGGEAVLHIRRGLMVRLLNSFQTSEQFQKICNKNFLSSDILGAEFVQTAHASFGRLDSGTRAEAKSILHDALSERAHLLHLYRQMDAALSEPSLVR